MVAVLVAKCAGLGLCILILTAWLLSYGIAIEYMRPSWHVVVTKGYVVFREHNGWGPDGRVRPLGWQTYAPFDSFLSPNPDYTADVHNLWIARRYKTTSWFATIVSLWLPFLIGAPVTIHLWRRDRRPRKGHCRECGYDLTGNESGVCPECGQER